MPPATRIRPYKDFLTPAMHRRFAMATATLAGACYVVSLFIGEWNSFLWSWFPLGRAGIRTALIFIPAFMIFILRVAQLHVGIRTSYSAWHTFRSYAFGFHVIQTIGWYCLSAYVYSEIFIWSASQSDDLSRIKLIPRTTRTMLNERPIYLTCFCMFTALIQAGFHLFYDYDRIDMPVPKWTTLGESGSSAVVAPAAQLKARFISLSLSCLKRATFSAVVSPTLYMLSIGIWPYSVRYLAWSFTRAFAGIFWHLPKSGSLPSTWLSEYSMVWKSFYSGFLLYALWEVGNAAFSAYVAQEPLKNERPITYESRDPNGSLLTGLRGKKLQTRAFAFWELVYISERFEGRRKAIFEDIDRKGGSAWSQIRDVCLEVINGVNQRIANYQSPPVPVATNPGVAKKDEVPSLPKIAKPLQDGVSAPGDLFFTPPRPNAAGARVIRAADEFAKTHGQSPPNGFSPKTRKLLASAEAAILTPKQRQALSAKNFGGLFGGWALWLLKSQVGWVFRQEYRRKITAIVLGGPYGDVGVIVDAVSSLARLAVCSLTEDKYGNVQRDVKVIIVTLTRTINKLESFKREIGVHWTDVEDRPESPEVDVILTALKDGLSQLIDAFGAYATDLGLNQGELRMAREATISSAPKRPEMGER